MAGVSRQAVSAVESGHSDPSLRVALALAQALGLSVEELFGPGEPAAPVTAASVAPLRGKHRPGGARPGRRPVRGPAAARRHRRGPRLPPGRRARQSRERARASRPRRPCATGSRRGTDDAGLELIAVRPIGPPRPTLVVAGCDPALPLLATPLSLLDPPVAFAWWPCGSGAALALASQGLVHAAGVHAQGTALRRPAAPRRRRRQVGFTAWREGLACGRELRPGITGLDAIAKHRLRIVNREPGAEARRLLDAERRAPRPRTPSDLPGYDTQAAGHLQVASAVAAGLADAGVASEPAARAYGLAFVPLAEEQFSLVIPARARRLPRGAGAAARCCPRRGCSPSWPACPATTLPPAATA